MWWSRKNQLHPYKSCGSNDAKVRTKMWSSPPDWPQITPPPMLKLAPKTLLSALAPETHEKHAIMQPCNSTIIIWQAILLPCNSIIISYSKLLWHLAITHLSHKHSYQHNILNFVTPLTCKYKTRHIFNMIFFEASQNHYHFTSIAWVLFPKTSTIAQVNTSIYMYIFNSIEATIAYSLNKKLFSHRV